MRDFHLGCVLSIATGRVLSKRYILGVYDVVAYMWAQSCNDGIAYQAMYPECKLWLLKQYPKFDTEQMQDHVRGLDQLVAQAENDRSDLKSVVFGWVDEMILLYGESLPVQPIPESHRRPINLFDEAKLIMGPGRTIFI